MPGAIVTDNSGDITIYADFRVAWIFRRGHTHDHTFNLSRAWVEVPSGRYEQRRWHMCHLLK